MAQQNDENYAPSPWEPIAEHVERYLATGGAEGYEWNGAHCIILATTGRRSGALRRTPLIKVADGDRYVIVASMGGAPSHPQWYLNVRDNPDVVIHDRDQVHERRAREVGGDEKAALWQLALEQWPAYAEYQEKTEREIPVVVCEPR